MLFPAFSTKNLEEVEDNEAVRIADQRGAFYQGRDAVDVHLLVFNRHREFCRLKNVRP